MKITEKQISEVEVVVETICDGCKGKVVKVSNFDAFECTIELTTGELFLECGSGEKREIHLCKKCALALFDHLQLDGYLVNTSEWIY